MSLAPDRTGLGVAVAAGLLGELRVDRLPAGQPLARLAGAVGVPAVVPDDAVLGMPGDVAGMGSQVFRRHLEITGRGPPLTRCPLLRLLYRFDIAPVHLVNHHCNSFFLASCLRLRTDLIRSE